MYVCIVPCDHRKVQYDTIPYCIRSSRSIGRSHSKNLITAFTNIICTSQPTPSCGRGINFVLKIKSKRNFEIALQDVSFCPIYHHHRLHASSEDGSLSFLVLCCLSLAPSRGTICIEHHQSNHAQDGIPGTGRSRRRGYPRKRIHRCLLHKGPRTLSRKGHQLSLSDFDPRRKSPGLHGQQTIRR